MLAHDGEWAGKRIVPAAWMKASTTVQPDAPNRICGYQVWLQPIPIRAGQFALRGNWGQWVLVDPVTRTTLVQTSARNGTGPLVALWLSMTGGK